MQDPLGTQPDAWFREMIEAGNRHASGKSVFRKAVSRRPVNYDERCGFLRTAACKSSQNHEYDTSDLLDHLRARGDTRGVRTSD